MPQSAPRQRGSVREPSSTRPAATAVAIAPIVIAPIVVMPVVSAPVVEEFYFGWWTPEPLFAFCCFPTAMVKGSKWTAGAELSISYAFIARAERADVGTDMPSSQSFERTRVDMLARRTQYPETMNDARYWHARSLAAVRSRWLGVIAPECTKLSACYAVVARQHKTGCTDEDLTNMAIASYNHVTYILNAPSSCGFSPICPPGKFCASIPSFLLTVQPPPPHAPLAPAHLSTLSA